jgi:hypothetical protein
MITQLVNRLNLTRRFITVCTKALHWPQSLATSIQATHSHPSSRISSRLRLCLPPCTVCAGPTVNRTPLLPPHHFDMSTSEAVLIVRAPYCTLSNAQVALLTTPLQQIGRIHWGWMTSETQFHKDSIAGGPEC